MNKLRYTLLLGFIAIAALGNSLDANADNLTVCNGDGSTTNGYLPIYGYYVDDYQVNQMIYPEELLEDMIGGTISSLTFYCDALGQNLNGAEYKVGLGTTTQTEYTSKTRLTVTTVASGLTLQTGATQLVITFSPFTYNGGNLVIDFEITDDAGFSTTKFYGENQSTNTAFNSYNGTYQNYTAQGAYSNGDLRKFLPKVTFGYTPSATPRILASPKDLTFNVVPNDDQMQTISVSGRNLSQGITATLNDANGVYKINNSTNPVNLGNGGTLSITYSPTAVGTHNATVTLSSSGVDPVTITLNGTCENFSTICDENGESNYLPVYGNWFDADQHNQMLYPASKFENSGMNGKKVTKITFFPTNGINFYDNNDNIDTDAKVTIKLANMPRGTQGYNGGYNSTNSPKEPDEFVVVKTITMPNYKQTDLHEWVFDDLDGEFIYDGGDLLIDVTTTASGYGSTTFAGESFTNEYPSYYSYNSNSPGQAFLPKVKFVFEDNAPVTSGTVTPAAIDFSTVGVGQSVSQTVTIKNTGNQDFVPTIATNLPAGSIFTVTGSGFDIANPPTMQPNQELVLTVTFTPTESTSYNGTITVTTVDGDNNPVAVGTVTLTGAGSIVYSGEVNPNPVSFGNVQVGQSATMTVTLTNTGNQSFTPTIDASGLNGTGFSVTPTSSGAIAPNGTQNFTVTFAPTAESFDNGTFTVTIPVPNGTPIVLTVNVTGNGYEYSPSTLMSNVTDMIQCLWHLYVHAG